MILQILNQFSSCSLENPLMVLHLLCWRPKNVLPLIERSICLCAIADSGINCALPDYYAHLEFRGILPSIHLLSNLRSPSLCPVSNSKRRNSLLPAESTEEASQGCCISVRLVSTSDTSLTGFGILQQEFRSIYAFTNQKMSK